MRVLPPALFCHKERPVDSEVSSAIIRKAAFFLTINFVIDILPINVELFTYFVLLKSNLFYYGIEYNYLITLKHIESIKKNHCFPGKTIMIILILSKRGKHQSTPSKILLLNDSVAGYWSYSYLLEVLQINEHISRSVKHMTSELL